jgi:hypothetical protein
MPEVKYRRHIQWLRDRADEIRAASENTVESKVAALAEIAESYETAARQLEDLLDRKLIE